MQPVEVPKSSNSSLSLSSRQWKILSSSLQDTGNLPVPASVSISFLGGQYIFFLLACNGTLVRYGRLFKNIKINE
jgi:hypothetical protein